VVGTQLNFKNCTQKCNKTPFRYNKIYKKSGEGTHPSLNSSTRGGNIHPFPYPTRSIHESPSQPTRAWHWIYVRAATSASRRQRGIFAACVCHFVSTVTRRPRRVIRQLISQTVYSTLCVTASRM